MAPPRVLRVTRSDDTDAFVLIHVVHAGPALLDLTLTATEGECPYTGVVKESTLKDLRVKNYQGSGEEWARIISVILGQAVHANEPALAGIEASARITGTGDESKELVVTIRKRVQSITQRLGAIALKQNDEQAIELFEWTGIAAARADALDTQIVGLQDRFQVAENTIHKLKAQLEELERAKSQHENQLMAHFVQLLNEKKLKIRNQQRLLVCATANAEKISEIQTVTDKSDKAAVSHRTAKRRIRAEDDMDDHSDEGFEPMDVDRQRFSDEPVRGQETDDEGPSTPQPLEEEETTATDNEPDEATEPTPTVARPQHAATSQHTSPPKQTAPPRRELPFNRRGPPLIRDSRPEASEAAEETAGETDDDEL